MKLKCKKCGVKTKKGSIHYCKVSKTSKYANEDDDGFLESTMFGFITDSWLLGWAFGGNPAGAMLGDALNQSTISEGNLEMTVNQDSVTFNEELISGQDGSTAPEFETSSSYTPTVETPPEVRAEPEPVFEPTPEPVTYTPEPTTYTPSTDYSSPSRDYSSPSTDYSSGSSDYSSGGSDFGGGGDWD